MIHIWYISYICYTHEDESHASYALHTWHTSCIWYTLFHLGWHFRMMSQSSQLKARTSFAPRFSEKRRSSFELFESVTKGAIGCTYNTYDTHHTHVTNDFFLVVDDLVHPPRVTDIGLGRRHIPREPGAEKVVSALRYTMTSGPPSPPDPERHAPIKDVQRHSRQVLENDLVTPILKFRGRVEMKDSSMLSSTNSTVLDLPPKFMRICSQRCRTTLQVSQNLANRKGTAIIFCNGRTAALRPSLILNEFAGIPAFSQELRWFSR